MRNAYEPYLQWIEENDKFSPKAEMDPEEVAYYKKQIQEYENTIKPAELFEMKLHHKQNQLKSYMELLISKAIKKEY